MTSPTLVRFTVFRLKFTSYSPFMRLIEFGMSVGWGSVSWFVSWYLGAQMRRKSSVDRAVFSEVFGKDFDQTLATAKKYQVRLQDLYLILIA